MKRNSILFKYKFNEDLLAAAVGGARAARFIMGALAPTNVHYMHLCIDLHNKHIEYIKN